MKVRVLYGRKAGEEEWMEQMITEREDQIPAASEWAKANGFVHLRVAEIDLSKPPDFTKTIRRRR